MIWITLVLIVILFALHEWDLWKAKKQIVELQYVVKELLIAHNRMQIDKKQNVVFGSFVNHNQQN